MFLLYRLADVVYFLLRIIGYRKKVILGNLRNSFPHKSEEELKEIQRKFYWNFANFMAETLKGFTVSRAELEKRVAFTNLEVLDEFVERQQSVVFLVAHQFNWEWALQAGSFQLPMQLDGIYQKIMNPDFDKLVLDSRSKFGAVLIEREKGLKQLISRRKVFRGIAIIADQFPPRNADTAVYWTQFLNQETAFNIGPERIAKMMKMPALFMNISSPKRGYYEIEFVKLTEPPYVSDGQILDAYVNSIEKLIAQSPSNWLWSHKRWKLTRKAYDIRMELNN